MVVDGVVVVVFRVVVVDSTVVGSSVVVSSPQPMSSNRMEISPCHVRGLMRMTLVDTGGSIICFLGVLLSDGPVNTCKVCINVLIYSFYFKWKY